MYPGMIFNTNTTSNVILGTYDIYVLMSYDTFYGTTDGQFTRPGNADGGYNIADSKCRDLPSIVQYQSKTKGKIDLKSAI